MKIESGKLLKIGLATTFALSLVVGNSAQIFAASNLKSTKSVEASIYPKPQDIKYASADGMKFDGTVSIVTHGQQDEATVTKVKELLDEQDIAYSEDSEVDANKATIFITSNKDHCDDCDNGFDANKALSEEQGYVLEASNDTNTKGQVNIIGADEDGAYYGVMTLTQMMEQSTNGNFAEATVSDYPSIKLRGYVEGFYGYPWSFEDRLGLMKDTSKYKMNTYIYAPKDDPYHKDQWRTLYPADKAEELRKLAVESKKDNMSFCWSIHPGYGFNYSNDTDYDYLIAKFEQLYDLGVRQFGISYDDLAGTPNGTQHANLINKVNQNFVKAKGDVKPLIVVGTRYCNGWGPSMNTYFKPFISTLDEDVVVMWTGANTMSAITKDAYDWPKQQTGVNKNLAAWWNYPVNDYCDGNLMMSPLENLDNDVDNLTGFFLNPMSQAEASKVAIFSGADYSWNVADFEKTSSWQRAIDELVPEASESFQRFADNISYIKDGFEFDESRYLVEKINALTSAIQNGSGIIEAASALKTEFETMRSDVTKLKTISNTNLGEEIDVFLAAYDVLAQAGIASMDAFVEASKGDLQATLSNMETLNAQLAAVEKFTVDSLETSGTKKNVVKVGEKRIKPMLRDSVNQIQNLLMKTISPTVSSKVFSSDENLENKSITVDRGNYIVTDLQAKLGVDGYVGFNLPKALKLSEIIVETAQANDLDIQYSLDGISWTTANSEVVDGVLKVSTPLSAAYVRVLNKTTNEIDVNIAKFKATIVYSLGTVTATTDLGTYDGNKISNAIDGKMNTKFYSSAGATVGSYVRVDLGKAIPLYDLKICYAVNPKGIQYGLDGFAATKLEVSTDAATWVQIGDIIEDDNYTVETIDGQQVASVSYNANGEMARYIRFTATERSDNWVQVFEVIYNKTVSNIGDDTVALIDSNFAVKNATNLYDGDLTTALTADSIKDGDYLTYRMSTITNVSDLVILQDAANICGAKVSVKDIAGSWKDVGSLDSQVNTISVNDRITEVKFSFDATKPLPKIYETIVKEREPSQVNKTSLTTAVEEADKITETELDKVVPVVVKEFKNALIEAKAILSDIYTTQETINNSFDRLSNAMQYLSFFKGDKTDLSAFIAKIDALDKDAYLKATWDILEPVYQEAKKVIADEDALVNDVNVSYDKLVRAFLQLRLKPNKDLLDELIQQVQGLSKDKYTVASWSNLVTVLKDAKATYTNNEATQEEVTLAENNLKGAIEKLEVIEVTPNKPTETTKPTTKPNGSKPGAAKTGDEISFAGVAGLTVSMALITLLAKKRKHN